MAQKRQGTGISKEIKQRNKLPSSPFYIAIGTVIDTADPLELGRVRVLCPTLNDNESIDINHLPPWVDCLSPFSGYKQSFKRGPEEVSSPGPIAYGFWNIPSKGAQVLVIAVGSNRYCLGCVSDHSYTSNTIPHGRFIGYKNTIVGPATASEGVVTFLTDNLHTAFGHSYEFISRGADYSATAVSAESLSSSFSKYPDDKDKEVTLPNEQKIINNQGYGKNQRDTESFSPTDCQTYAWVTPGFHAMSMDDRAENCRMRFRTTTGHQIILDDTNERIIINTNEGKSFIEMDSKGNIDVHAERHLSFHSSKDMSFTSDGKIRFRAQQGIHFLSDNDIRFHSINDTHFRAADVKMDASGSVFLNIAASINLKAQTSIKIESASVNLKGSTGVNISSAVVSIGASTTINQNAPKIYLNGPPGPTASAATVNSSEFAHSTIRVPFRINNQVQSWSRSMINPLKSDNDALNNSINYYDYGNMEHTYDSTDVGRIELGETIPRNSKWRR